MLSLLTAFFLAYGDAAWYWWALWTFFLLVTFMKETQK